MRILRRIKLGTNYSINQSSSKIECLNQNQPEGISMAIPMKNGGMKKSRVIFLVVMSGITTGIGAFVGAIIGGISEEVIAICLSFATGAMLYIISRRINSRSKQFISWQNDGDWKHNWIFVRIICNEIDHIVNIINNCENIINNCENLVKKCHIW